MRKILSGRVEQGRIMGMPWSAPSGPDGAFEFLGPCGMMLRVVSTCGDNHPDALGWDHVSVSTPKRIPNWEEMCFVKEAFWRDDEVVFQLHPAKADWVNNHPRVLHLWRKIDQDPPLPPSIFVGIKEDGTYANAAEARAGFERAKARGDL